MILVGIEVSLWTASLIAKRRPDLARPIVSGMARLLEETGIRPRVKA